jgi:hypothetical protein
MNMSLAAEDPSLIGVDAPPETERDARLVRVLSRARGRFRVAFTERLLLSAGGFFVVAGVLVIVLGWVGASHTVLVAGQIPYVISGGLLGIGLIFLGGFLYFGYWLALIVRQGEQRLEEDGALLAAVEETNRLLRSSLATVGATGGLDPSVAVSTAGFVATATGTMFHRSTCPAVAGKSNLRDVGGGGGLSPCGICDPLGLREV